MVRTPKGTYPMTDFTGREQTYDEQKFLVAPVKKGKSLLFLTLVWCSYLCFSASVRGSGGPAAFLGFNSTQSNYLMLKYSTDVYFI